MPVEQVAKRKEEIYLEILPQLKAVPEVLEHIEASYKQIPFAVVSGSTRDSVTASLRTLNILDRFDSPGLRRRLPAEASPTPSPF